MGEQSLTIFGNCVFEGREVVWEMAFGGVLWVEQLAVGVLLSEQVCLQCRLCPFLMMLL